jgi:hypothetical protein
MLKILGAIVQNLFTLANLLPEFVHSSKNVRSRYNFTRHTSPYEE